ncbi:MAG: hypothetical protein M1533_02495 [Candidatus Thermoplasmatota archaeon]|jgi:hypothetical protein|nr:hypothetical protein [Candidatus Thermoplasmatota archaeon]MCL5793621.1 hypothetical protein [Candidatus Thermoplasmatota archaeon]
MPDLIRKSVYIAGKDVNIEVEYRLNFQGSKSCGFIKVLRGRPMKDEEQYEIYMELLECGLSLPELNKAMDKVKDEIENGVLDVEL